MSTNETVTIHMDASLGGGIFTMLRDEFEENMKMNEQVHRMMDRALERMAGTAKALAAFAEIPLIDHSEVERVATKYLSGENR